MFPDTSSCEVDALIMQTASQILSVAALVSSHDLSSLYAWLGNVQAPLDCMATVAGVIGRLETRTVANQRS
jgi:hypothetical protein